MAMAAAMFMAAAQDTPAAPEALYLVGQFSNWVLPVDGGTEFALTDEDGDGIYTGTYNVAAEELVFKVFSAKTDCTDSQLAGWRSCIFRQALYNNSSLKFE